MLWLAICPLLLEFRIIDSVSIKKYVFCRGSIPTVANGETATYSSEIYQVEPSGNLQKLVFSKVDAAELDVLLTQGSYVDAYFSLDVYDYQQFTGIRLVAKRLVVHSF